MAAENFQEVFIALSELFKPYVPYLDVVQDTDRDFYLNTYFLMKNKQPLFFGAVNIKKNYVSFHIMPIYVNPDLLKGLSLELTKRKQGKSCFNFKKVDSILFSELAQLVEQGFLYYQQEGYINKVDH